MHARRMMWSGARSILNQINDKPKPIYVETVIGTDMESLWHHTQSPELHQQWDLRFSEIHYLPRNSVDPTQLFRYKTRIGFGFHIEGTGESVASRPSRSGARTSALVFGSQQRMSLIRSGSGYWRYTPVQDGIRFATEYDYETRFGILGRLFDQIVFRPMFGYATAWSFDLLRLWLERGIRPAALIRNAAVHYISVALLMIIWMWMGFVPKLFVPEGGDLALLKASGLFTGVEEGALRLLGLIEIVVGFAAVWFHRNKYSWMLQIGMLTALTAAGIAAEPALLASPFNPAIVGVPMLGLMLAARLTMDDVPSASRCIREKNRNPRKDR
ncbi:DoxX-like family protein [Paenibacillus kobensis]|uniref:DoxX-like family protein n=1 Tax=Paenibacillus kobensis TaxID=59841 RepID=UPI001FEA09A8|nr:DoxX-like family protein [Paenibacillus kobensis]